MKLQLDTVNKHITLEEKVNLNELFELLKKLFPDGKWEEYNLESKQIINWTSPVVIEKSRGWWDDPYRPTWSSPSLKTPVNPYEIQCSTLLNFDIN